MEKIKAYDFPDFWEEILIMIEGQQNCLVFDLPQGSAERKKVEISFNHTLQNIVIEKIQRIQNPKLWKVFNNEKKDVEYKNGG